MNTAPKRAVALAAGFDPPPVLFERVLLWPGSFDPPGKHHRKIAEALVALRKALLANEPAVPIRIIIKTVGNYGTKQQRAANHHRIAMTRLAFEDLPAVEFDFSDLEEETGFTSNHQLQAGLAFEPVHTLSHEYFTPTHTIPGILREVWHAIGADNVSGIRTEWNEGRRMWEYGRFLIITRPGHTPEVLPPRSKLLELQRHGSSSDIRQRVTGGKPYRTLVANAAVADYLAQHGVYKPTMITRSQ